MADHKNEIHATKSVLHPRNLHRERYDFKLLIATCPELANYLKINAFNDESIDFANPKAVKWLNKALLKQYYKVDYWDIPAGYLCPPIPGRADYIHNIADLLASSNKGMIPTGNKINCLDIGVGASCIFPIIARSEYGWSFVGSETDETAISSARKICHYNKNLNDAVEIRHQGNPKDIFHGILSRNKILM
jgi:23S rRNA (adenine1618-N6)-methyltransferase